MIHEARSREGHRAHAPLDYSAGAGGRPPPGLELHLLYANLVPALGPGWERTRQIYSSAHGPSGAKIHIGRARKRW